MSRPSRPRRRPVGWVPGGRDRPVLAAVAGLRLTLTVGPPTAQVSVSGSGFGANERVDVSFDTTDEASLVTSSGGSFGKVTVRVPASAVPGTHWITAEGHHSGIAYQAAFTVRTDRAQFHNTVTHKGWNPHEKVLAPSTVSGLGQDWTGATAGPLGSSSPVVANGVVYVGSPDNNLYTYDLDAGPAAPVRPKPDELHPDLGLTAQG